MLKEKSNAMDDFFSFYYQKTCIKKKGRKIGHHTKWNCADDLIHIMM
jgi:phosphoribosylaminoimidazole carboxylase (NCAIR synthetase)